MLDVTRLERRAKMRIAASQALGAAMRCRKRAPLRFGTHT